ncbi:MAG: DNA polymerase IV [Elusimicrobia bacterium]|nr:DNA polymerase IV [Elusimicrobiota bacterium]
MNQNQENRVILHVDMNAFFASIEQKANPFLREKPVLVVADSRRRSVVMTASYPARKFGVKTGMNLYEAKKFCPQAIVVEGNAEKYLDSTRKLVNILESFTDQVEIFSCDEAFLDVTHSLKFFAKDGVSLAKMVQEKIKTLLGLSSSIGVAPNKLLAKLASEKKKPNGLTVILPEEIEKILAETPVDELCGIGDKIKRKLNQLGIRSCKDLGDMELGKLQNYFGFWGNILKRMGQGKDESRVRRITEQETVKSIGHSTTFPKDTANMEILQSFLRLLSEKVAVRLRKGRYQGLTVVLTLRYKDFTTFTRQVQRKEPTDDGYEIFATSLVILKKTQPFLQPIRLLGISVSSLIRETSQGFLFETMRQRKKVNSAMDEINQKFGFFSLKPLRLNYAQQFGILDPPIPPTHHTF